VSWSGHDDGPSEPPQSGGDAADGEPLPARWPMHADALLPRERWLWFEQLWEDTCRLRERYRLPVRSGWWEDEIQTEALAALAAWIDRYDSGEWDDPPGKLGLLFDLERIGVLLRDGNDPFDPRRDRTPFIGFLLRTGCEPPDGRE